MTEPPFLEEVAEAVDDHLFAVSDDPRQVAECAITAWLKAAEAADWVIIKRPYLSDNGWYQQLDAKGNPMIPTSCREVEPR